MRVFPDIPVCTKGNETRMGKGKGTFEYWAARVPIGRIIFEIGGGGIRPEVAKEALRLASVKFPVKTEFVTKDGRLYPSSMTSTYDCSTSKTWIYACRRDIRRRASIASYPR